MLLNFAKNKNTKHEKPLTVNRLPTVTRSRLYISTMYATYEFHSHHDHSFFEIENFPKGKDPLLSYLTHHDDNNDI